MKKVAELSLMGKIYKKKKKMNSFPNRKKCNNKLTNQVMVQFSSVQSLSHV